MKRLGLISLILLLTGCATSTYKTGNEFASENVAKIEKGVTTDSQLVLLIGQPFMKTVISETEQKWIYSHTVANAKATNYVFSMQVESTGITKMLDVLLKDGVVVNYAYTESALPGSVKVN
ncbi:hypothetical protein [Rheinheimera soli]|uniref:Outer membrane protein assembly factor BamE n=1 Tax=Rheinheimera soli TaxID=443616 RepID=A0ABU1VVL6_9GAMM|nr:hypothetical protein [Rheinheimera soli]MDR7119766.1 hypothetical protein [Rheinheimera soli]